MRVISRQFRPLDPRILYTLSSRVVDRNGLGEDILSIVIERRHLNSWCRHLESQVGDIETLSRWYEAHLCFGATEYGVRMAVQSRVSTA
jgi:hypothetical protein